MNVFGGSQAGETKKTISKLEDSIKIIKFELNEKMDKIENNTKTQVGVIETVMRKIQVIELKLLAIEQLTEKLKFKVSDLEDNDKNMKSKILHLKESHTENTDPK